MEMLDHDGPVIFDCLVEKHENCFPMIPSGEPHNKMLLGEASTRTPSRKAARCWCDPASAGAACPPHPRDISSE